MAPYAFNAFFSSGMSDAVSPFLTNSSKKWATNFALKKALLTAGLLLLSFLFSFYDYNLAYFSLSFVYLLSGTGAILGAFEDGKNLEINIDTLMMMAAFLSLFIGSGFEGGLLLVLFELSGSMEESVINKANSALRDLQKISPEKALVVEEGRPLKEVSVQDISLGTKILVKSGEYVPLDGVIVEGSSLFDLSHITGESLPIRKNAEEEVPAGAKNTHQAVVLTVKKTSTESTLKKIIDLIDQAKEQKPRIQTAIDRFGKKYASCVMISSALLSIFLPLFFSLPYWGVEGSIYRALTFLITASPCALIIGAPTAYLAAVSSCAKKGILLKGGSVLDALTRCQHICFDKTGTLTSGQLSLKNVTLLQGDFPVEKALAIAKSLERHVSHPLASAVEKYTKNLPVYPVENFSSSIGQGVAGTLKIEGIKYHARIGSKSFMQKKLPSFIASSLTRSEAFLHIGDALFVLHFEDEIRKEAYTLVKELQEQEQIFPVILTGDHEKAALSVAKKLSITEIFFNLLPEEKLDLVAKLSLEKGLIMVGDGMNDAPSLARATVGISLGITGSGAAIQASDVVLLSDALKEIRWLLQKSRQSVRVIRQNVVLAVSTIVIASSFALAGMMPLWLSVILHEGGTVAVGLNSLRLLRRNKTV